MKYLLFITGIIVIISCSDGLDGDCSKNIPLSSNGIIFSSSKDSAVVTTGDNQSWWLSEINVDGDEFYNFESIDVLSPNFLIKIDSLTFERTEGTTISLKVEQNLTSEDRTFSVTLQDGNCFNYISITQNSN